MRLSLEQAIRRYGPIADGVWGNESKWCKSVEIPPEISAYWINSSTNAPTTKIYCNIDINVMLLRALDNIKNENLLGEIKTFDGCFNIRNVRGNPTKISAHSYACAIDCNAKEQPLGSPTVFSAKFVECWTNEGWSWGGDFKRLDPMHFSIGW